MLVRVQAAPKSSNQFQQRSTRSSEEIQLPKRKKYQTVNGFTHKPSFLQLLGIFLMCTLVVLHANTIPAVYEIGHPLLSVFCVFYYISLIGVIIEYCRLTYSDPVDPRLLVEHYKERQKDRKLLVYCTQCRVLVHKYSYHCNTCQRCVQQFDHHCKYANNCVGKQNYSIFYRLLLFLIFNMFLLIIQALWVLIATNQTYKWIGLIMIIIASLATVALLYLACFHCYISFFNYGTTLKYLRGQEIEETIKGSAPKQSSQTESVAQPNIIYHRQVSQNQRIIHSSRPELMQTDIGLKRQYLY